MDSTLPDHFRELYAKSLAGTLSAEESAELLQMLDRKDAEAILSPVLYEQWQQLQAKNGLKGIPDDKIGELLRSLPREERGDVRPVAARVLSLSKRWRWVAASVLIFIAATFIILIRSPFRPAAPVLAPVASVSDIPPGREGAVLTLANGEQVLLDTVQRRLVALQGGAEVKVMNGVLSYEGAGADVVYNTMSTPRGRQFHITLPDGTDVWLNAASSIRYPTSFTGKERRVEVAGEAYFEVKSDPRKPFRVNVREQVEVEVLGTNFNINAYEDEAGIRTTLLEGSVRISKGTEELKLLPGQQGLATSGPGEGAKIRLVSHVNTGNVMAWKNGVFSFDGLKLDDIMRQVARWYDVEVVFEKDVPDKTFTGDVGRNVKLPSLLKALEESGVRFRMEGRRIVILP